MENKDFSKAHVLFSQSFAQDPSALLDDVDDIEYLLLEYAAVDGKEVATRSQTDSLMKIYEAGIRVRPSEKGVWLARRAMLASRFEKDYSAELERFAKEAIESSPMDCPLVLFHLYLDHAVGNHSQAEAALAWDWIDRILYLRSAFKPFEAESCSRMERSLTIKMLTALPPCERIMTQGSSNRSDAMHLAFLIEVHLSGCGDAAFWKAEADAAAQQKDLPPSVLRLFAEEFLSQGNLSDAAAWWEKAIQAEPQAEYVAADLLFLAAIQKYQENYPAARQSLLSASQRLPSWGEPYMQLADLYRDGARACKMSAFDLKALHWLLIDLCQKAMNSDPSYADEAQRRIFGYMQEMPDNADLSLRGLNPGDTWPLKCWMSTVVKVRAK